MEELDYRQTPRRSGKNDDPAKHAADKEMLKLIAVDRTIRTVLRAMAFDPTALISGASGRLNIAAVCRITGLPKIQVQNAIQSMRSIAPELL